MRMRDGAVEPPDQPERAPVWIVLLVMLVVIATDLGVVFAIVQVAPHAILPAAVVGAVLLGLTDKVVGRAMTAHRKSH
jgi:hypothetical protein